MSEREWRPPDWGQIQHSGLQPPPIDPMPWPRYHWPPWPPWSPVDPAPLREKFVELIEPEDVIALQQAKMTAIETQLKAQLEFMRVQTEAQLSLARNQMEILSKYPR